MRLLLSFDKCLVASGTIVHSLLLPANAAAPDLQWMTSLKSQKDTGDYLHLDLRRMV